MLLLVPGQVEEVAEVLSRPKIAKKYRIVPGDRDALLQLLRADAVLLPDEPAPGVCRDPDDDYLLGCAAYRDVTIVDARTFLAVLSAVQG